ncbi:MAG: amino acid adenylation domain-containing protein [Acidobacteriia bacterium]|nr:amino acid adenylation domain-containing protein [Terriglobia bacterium]
MKTQEKVTEPREGRIEDSYSLSPMQQAMLFNYLDDRHSGVDIEQIVSTLHERVHPAHFQQAWRRVVERHPILRTTFEWEALADPVQRVHSHAFPPFEEFDWHSLSPAEQEKGLTSYLDSDRHRGFLLNEPPLMRIVLFQMGAEDYRCVWTFHHALLDGRSFPLVLKEVFAFYEAFSQGRELTLDVPRPFGDFINWFQEKDHLKSEPFWKEMLKGFTTPTLLNLSREPVQEPGAKTHGAREVRLSKELTAALNSCARENGLTVNTFIQGAWSLLLHHYSGEDDVVFGATRACRRTALEGAESMMGIFINTLPVRVQMTSDMSLIPFLKGLRAQQVVLRDYEHTPLHLVQGWTEVPRGKPLFDSIVVFENYLLNAALRAGGGHWLHREFRYIGQTNFPLTLIGYADEELLLRIEYYRNRFDDSAIERMLVHLKVLLGNMVANPNQRLAEVKILGNDEYRQLVEGWNETAVAYPEGVLLHQLFEAQVEKTPDAVAVVFEGEQLSYRQLNQRANQLAHFLRSLGAAPDTFVGVCMERSLEMVVALYGILKAGAAYVPIDPDYPRERVAFMLEDAHTPVLLTQQRLAADLPAHGARMVCLDTAWPEISQHRGQNPEVTATAGNLAYMIYTSGSTGKPKGAMNTHRGISNRLLWMQERYQLTAANVVMQKTPFSFDVSVWEFFWPLLNGASLVVARPGGHQDPAYLADLIEHRHITVLHFVPSMLRVFLEEPGLERCRSLRHVICSGEALGFDLQERFFERLHAQLHNLYGPTEAAVDVTHWTCQPNSPLHFVPIGRPVANTQTYILDGRLQPVPIGVAGELHLGGVQIGRGYHNRPELTAEKFIPDPFRQEPGARLYKTGDLARYLPDGNIEFLGRIDHQVKIRGLRIELGEIEFQLAAHPAVKEVVVVARQDEPGDQRLVAYLVAGEAAAPGTSELRTFLLHTLPDYMVPAAFVWLKQLPLSPNGKVDRRALPAPDKTQRDLEKPFVAPRTELERALAGLWQSALNVEKVGLEDNFFELGGHSLLLVQVHGKLRAHLHRDLPITELFQYPTIRALAEHLSESAPKEGSTKNIRRRAERQIAARSRRVELEKELDK